MRESPSLLRGHVAGCAHPRAALRQRGTALRAPREAEVTDLGRAVGGQQHVGRLEITVNDPSLVCCLYGRRQGCNQGRGLIRRHRRSRELLGQAAAVDKLHGVVRPSVRVTHVVDLHDVRVPQPRHRLRLALEPLPLVRACVRAGERHLQCNDAVQAQVAGPEDDAHATPAQQLLDFIAGNLGQIRTWLK